MKNVKKIFIILLIFIMLSLLIQNKAVFGESIMNYVNTVSSANEDSDVTPSVRKIAAAVIDITKIISAGVAIIMLVMVAIKYMMAAPGEKADIKKHAVPYFVGAIIMFSCTGILSIIQKFSSSI